MVIDLFADKKVLSREDRLITDEARRIVQELHKVKLLFNEVTDPYEIESLIYKMKELELHYSFLIKEAKLGKIINSDSFGGIL